MPLPIKEIFDEHTFTNKKVKSISFQSPYKELKEIISESNLRILHGLDVSGHTPHILSEEISETEERKQLIGPGVDGYIFYKTSGLSSKTAILLRTADCAPVTFSSTDGNMIGLVHIGWKGLVQGIIENMHSEIQKIGYKEEEIHFWIGPMAGEGFEFGEQDFEEYIGNFAKKIGLQDFKKSIHKEVGKVSFNFRELVKQTLIVQGFQESQINHSKRSTLDKNEKIPSWRKGNNERITTIIYS